VWEAGLLLPNLALPIPTKFLASPAKTLGAFGLVWWWLTNAYHVSILGRTLPRETFTNHYHRGEGITHSTDTMCYVGLELVVYGAVELGDVMLFFVGEQGLFGLEVYTRLVGHTDGVCDCGILATGLH